MSTFVVYLRLVVLQARSQLQYRTNFAFSLAGTFLFTTLDFAAILVVFHNIDTLAGWTAGEVALLYAAAALSYAMADIVLGSLDRLPEMVRDGTFDVLLVRPRSSFFQLIGTDFALRRAGRLIQALVVLVVVVGGFTATSWTVPKLLLLAMTVVSGAVIMGAVWVVAACVAFWVVEAGEFVNAFTTGSLFLAQYPVDIYAGWLRRVVVFLIPIGFVIYLPASHLLGKPSVVELPVAVRFGSPVVAAVAAGIAVLVWRRAVMHYRSAGG